MHVRVTGEVDLERPVLVEGLPGLGLVGKLATDHVVEELGMAYYGWVACPNLQKVATYRAGDHTVRPPVRLYADGERDLLALQSDVPISPTSVSCFTECVTEWAVSEDATPVYVTGLDVGEPPPEQERGIFGVATGDGGRTLAEHGIDPPTEDGVWSGPTGALLDRARDFDVDALGVIVESRADLPDPEGACVLVERVLDPIADVDVDVSALREHAQEIREQQAEFARDMGEPEGDESSRTELTRMFQ